MTDHVDQVLTTWAERRPEWELEGMAVFGRLARLQRVVELQRADVLRPLGLSESDVDVMASLWRHPDGLRPRDLRASMMIGSGTLTPILDRLEARALLSRHDDPDDQRGRLLTLTSAGRDLVPQVVGALLDVENQLLAILSPSARRRLASDLRKLLSGAEQDVPIG